MTQWRDKAWAEFPEFRSLLEQDSWSCHVFLFELVRFSVEAHYAHDSDALRRAYGFAKWCWEQPGFLANAASVSFYEHVFDEWELRHEVVPLLPPAVKTAVLPLLEWRLPSERFAEVDRLLSETNPPA